VLFSYFINFFYGTTFANFDKEKGTKISSVKKIVRNMKEWQEIEI